MIVAIACWTGNIKLYQTHGGWVVVKIDKNKINYIIHNLRILLDLFLIIACAFILSVGVMLVFVSYHNIDSALNALLFAKEFNLDWWSMSDAYSFSFNESNENVIYNLIPYPALYIDAVSNLRFAIFLIGVGAFAFGWGLADLVSMIVVEPRKSSVLHFSQEVQDVAPKHRKGDERKKVRK
jgi:hypothetical protein